MLLAKYGRHDLVSASGLDADDVPGFPCSLVDQAFGAMQALRVGSIRQQLSRDENTIGTMEGRHQNDTRCLRLIVKPLARSSEHKDKDQPDDNIVLPGCPREIPKNQSLAEFTGSLRYGVLHYCQSNIGGS